MSASLAWLLLAAEASGAWTEALRDRVRAGALEGIVEEIDRAADGSDAWRQRREDLELLAAQHGRILSRLNAGPRPALAAFLESPPEGEVAGAGPDGIRIRAGGAGTLTLAWGALKPYERYRLAETASRGEPEDRLARALLAAELGLPAETRRILEGFPDGPLAARARSLAASLPLPEAPDPSPPGPGPGDPPKVPDAADPDAAFDAARKRLAAGDAAGAKEALRLLIERHGGTPWYTPERRQAIAGLTARCEAVLAEKARWIPLFDGKTIEGWSKGAGNWDVAGDAIRGHKGSDFNALHRASPVKGPRWVFSAEFACGGPVAVGLSFCQGSQDKWVFSIEEEPGRTRRRAAIDPYRNHRWLGYARAQAEHPGVHPGAWNEVAVRANGAQVEGWLNGAKVISAEIPDLRPGDLGIVYQGRIGEARFRNLRVREE